MTKPPAPTTNPFFGVGPITDGVRDEVEARLLRFAFERWLEATYRKRDAAGRDIGPYTAGELSRSMHRGEPADSVLTDMLREIHRYFGFPKTHRMAVGLGGGHAGFTVAALHLVSGHDAGQHILIDTPRPESDAASAGGFFRQSWGAQLIRLLEQTGRDAAARLHFTEGEGVIPDPDTLQRQGIRLIFGVGHETTGATTYARQDITNLLAWIERDPAHHHAVLDATSLLGAMPWEPAINRAVMETCSLYTPLQKAIGGISGYYIAAFTPAALALIERNAAAPAWAIPRQLQLAPPTDPAKPLSSPRSTAIGPFYDPVTDRMLGGVINTYSVLAFAETRFGLLRMERRIGSVDAMNARSVANRAAVEQWVAAHPRFALGVTDPERRGAAVTLLNVVDPEITDPVLHARIIARSKELLGFQGLAFADGAHEPGRDTARYVNAFPGTPGDYRAWIGDVREVSDITALLDNLDYAYARAKACVLAEMATPAAGAAGAPDAATVPASEWRQGREAAETLAAILGALDTATSAERRQTLLEAHKAQLNHAATTLADDLRRLTMALTD